mmetsp:Transcript_5935/g.19641  ORF Transcript_5935/g.19641 Transcript_5935/m.19641 type:complete len:209 (+) Transcript_5935:216-842(+)
MGGVGGGAVPSALARGTAAARRLQLGEGRPAGPLRARALHARRNAPLPPRARAARPRAPPAQLCGKAVRPARPTRTRGRHQSAAARQVIRQAVRLAWCSKGNRLPAQLPFGRGRAWLLRGGGAAGARGGGRVHQVLFQLRFRHRRVGAQHAACLFALHVRGVRRARDGGGRAGGGRSIHRPADPHHRRLWLRQGQHGRARHRALLRLA